MSSFIFYWHLFIIIFFLFTMKKTYIEIINDLFLKSTKYYKIAALMDKSMFIPVGSIMRLWVSSPATQISTIRKRLEDHGYTITNFMCYNIKRKERESYYCVHRNNKEQYIKHKKMFEKNLNII